MATKKTAQTEIPKQFSESANAYLDRLAKGQESMAAAVETVRARNTRIADKFIEALFASQREAIALGKAVMAEPAAYGKNMDAVMQSMSTAQERALDVAKTVYREQAEAAGEIREVAEKNFEAVKSYTPNMERFTSMWMPAAK